MIFILNCFKLWERNQLSSNDFVSVMRTLQLTAVSTTRYFNYDCYELRGYSVHTDLECQYARKQDIQDKDLKINLWTITTCLIELVLRNIMLVFLWNVKINLTNTNTDKHTHHPPHILFVFQTIPWPLSALFNAKDLRLSLISHLWFIKETFLIVIKPLILNWSAHSRPDTVER